MIKTTVMPPISSKLYDYTKASKVSVQLINITRDVQEVYVSGMVSNGKDIKVYSEPGYKPPEPIAIPPGTSYKLNQENYERAFDFDHMRFEGISKDQALQGNIPEGSYTFCFQAFNYKTNEPVSESYPGGCSNEIVLSDQPPPEIVQPENEANIPTEAPTIPIVWTRSTVASMDIQYKLMIFELIKGTTNINEAVKTGRLPLVLDETTKNNSYMLTSPGRSLVPGKDYVCAVRANDPTNKFNFRNQGWSDPCIFHYGKGSIEVIPLDNTLKAGIELIFPVLEDSLISQYPEFRWRMDGAVKGLTYRLDIYTLPELGDVDSATFFNNAKLLWTKKGIKEPRLVWPKDQPPVDPNTVYMWQVTAVKETGELIAKSKKEPFASSGGGGGKSCTCTLSATQTNFSVCQGGSITIPAPGFTSNGCSFYERFRRQYKWNTGNWSNCPVFFCSLPGLTVNLSSIGVNTSTPGVYPVTITVRMGNTPSASQCIQNYTLTVYPAMNNMQILATPCNPVDACNNACTPIQEICTGEDAYLFIPGNCPGTAWYDPAIKWLYQDISQTGSALPIQCWGTGNPRYTNTISNSSLCAGSNMNYFVRKYGAIPPPSYPSSCGWGSKDLTVWCPTVAGNMNISSTTHNVVTVNPFEYTVCSNDLIVGSGGPPVYPIKIILGLQNEKGDIQKWEKTQQGSSQGFVTPFPVCNNPVFCFDPSTAPGPASCCDNIEDEITGPGVYEYRVYVRNGTCNEKFTRIKVTVEDPFIPQLISDKYVVCPNEDAAVSFDATNMPPNATIQWFYMVNCSGPWIPPSVNPNVQTSTSNVQLTNYIGNLNPWYMPPASSSAISTSLCWQAVVTSTVCGPNPSNPLQIDIRQAPGTPQVTASPPSPLCCGDICTLTSTTQVYPTTGPLTYQWYLNSMYNPIPGATQDSYSFTCSLATQGNYFLVVSNPCERVQSNTVSITCCCVLVSISGPCCSDGITPITLTASASSTCGNAIVSYVWTGPNGWTGSGPSVTLNPPPSFYPGGLDRWTYTVTATDAMGCQSSATHTICACP